MELDDKGKITTAKDVLKSLKEEWGDHVETTQTEGAPTPTAPQSTGDGMTRDQILSIQDTNERQAAISSHHDLFGY